MLYEVITIVEINAQGTGVLLVEQNATMALSIASHGFVMETGKLVMDKSAAELLAAVRHAQIERPRVGRGPVAVHDASDSYNFV